MSQIRFATKEDLGFIIEMCAAHAAYEQSEYSPKGKIELLEKSLFGTSPDLYCLVVEQDGQLLGYATYMRQYSTWDASHYIYMDCLFMNEGTRSKGWGEKLVRKIQEEGKKLGCQLIQWQTPEFNTRAIQFYTRLGATSKSKERFFLDI